MAIELTTLLQHANAVGTRQADGTHIFINDHGGISGRSGLGFFKHLFSSSARQEENRATLQAFQESIVANPKYRVQLESEQITRFFQTQRAQGTPLTAREMQQVHVMLDVEKIGEVGQELVELNLIPNLDASGFAWFCMGKGFGVGSVEEIKEALNAYYVSQHCEAKAREALSAAGVKPENLEAAMMALKASAAWTSALDSAFEGNVSDLTHTTVMGRFGAALGTAAGLLNAMVEDGEDFMAHVASGGSQGIDLFNRTLVAVRNGSIALEEGPNFMRFCMAEHFDLSTPERLGTAISNYCVGINAEGIFITLARSNGLPDEVGKSLAKNPEFAGRVRSALLEASPPPATPARAQIIAIMDTVSTEFMAEKNDDIRALLRLAGGSEGASSSSAEPAGEIDENFIYGMLNPLLADSALLEQLLNPAQGTAQGIREHLLELKTTVDFIAGLPTEADPAVQKQFVVTPEEKQRLLHIIPGTPLRDPVQIKAALRKSRSVAGNLTPLKAPGLTRAEMIDSLMRATSTYLPRSDSPPAQGGPPAETQDAHRTVLALALDSLQFTPDQAAELFGMVSGAGGVELGRGLTSMANVCGERNLAVQERRLRTCVPTLDSIRMILGRRAGARTLEDPLYYSAAMDARDVPGLLFEKTVTALDAMGSDLPGHFALSRVEPRLTHAQWDALTPVMEMVDEGGFSDPFNRVAAIQMVAASAWELLAESEANGGRPLTPEQVWRVVIGGEAPVGITTENLGARIYNAASERIFQRAQAMNPGYAMSELEVILPGLVANGIPLQFFCDAFQPGGRLSLGNFRFGLPPVSSLEQYSADNAYGLVTDWGRRKESADGNPSRMTIRTLDGAADLTLDHHFIPHSENVADNPIFTGIIQRCRSISSSEQQFQRIMQCLSQGGTINLRVIAGLFGVFLSEHSHFDSTVTPQPNGDVVVTLVNGPADRPCGAHIQFTITPAGDTRATDIGLELRG